MCVSYSRELALAHARAFRQIIESPWYQEAFPEFKIGRKNTEVELTTTMNGGRYTVSVEGTLTGRGAGLIIIDDPIKPESAMSDAERNSVNDWYRSTASTRHDNADAGRTIIVMQRVHENDLLGHLLNIEGDRWEVLKIPAIATTTEEYRIGVEANDVFVREKGTVIDPNRMGLSFVEKQRKLLGSINFEAQYQQIPTPITGNIVKREWVKEYEEEARFGKPKATILSLDPASGTSDQNDYSVLTSWLIYDDLYLLSTVNRIRLEYPDLVEFVYDRSFNSQAEHLLVEYAGIGVGLYQDLRGRIPGRVHKCPPKGDKASRLTGITSMIENGYMQIPKQERPWKAEFVRELLSFPNCRFDDQVDSMTQALIWIRESTYKPSTYKRPFVRPRGANRPWQKQN